MDTDDIMNLLKIVQRTKIIVNIAHILNPASYRYTHKKKMEFRLKRK